MALVTTLDLAAGSDMGLLPVYAAGPALAAARSPVRTVIALGGLAIALCLVSATVDGLLGHVRLYVALVAIALVTAGACYAAMRRQRAERKLVDARAVADALEGFLLPVPPPCIGPLRIAASYVSAERGMRVGGDLYEAVPAGEGVRVIIADVQGKGLAAVRSAGTVLAAFRESAPYARDLAQVGERIEDALQRAAGEERFVTAVLAEIRPDGTVHLLNRGHPAPLLMRRHGDVELLEPARHALPFGMTALLEPPGERVAVTRCRLAPGERLLLYTDGLSEARDRAGRFYPLLERAAGPLAEADPARALQLLRGDVARHTGAGPADDSALLVLDFLGSSAHGLGG
ncbi:hypothetical protein BIV57_14465 [Mangrovactinospora gilvigrisea]|uniref:PPM-type phosphatase domain-containing protein n=2 Tax=Mangrovactinospora gilvigrisea TaxID=1428644 RepID=A0A1J7CAU9_9ACTN|nr:hypothetical protein BIV57_14465 [Mangrovactinospora gilvigrisea]